MRLSEIGEIGLIQRVREAAGASRPAGLAVGIGDDAAVLDIPAGTQVVVTADLLVEDVHFRRDWSDPYSIGWKAAAVSLSDIAAMGAWPTFGFLSLAVPAPEAVEDVERLIDGLRDCFHRYGAALAGGDTNAAPDRLTVSVTLLGSVPAGQAWTRAGARPGDILLVTDSLGQSAAGLALLQEIGPVKAEKAGRDLVQIHRRPQPRLVAARAAAATGKVRAAMDLSDGLAADLPKLCAESGVGARIQADALPVVEAVRNAARTLDRDPLEWALSGGEDFELLLAVAPGDADAVRAAVEEAGTPLTVIGEIVRSGLRLVTATGEQDLLAAPGGWDHFRS